MKTDQVKRWIEIMDTTLRDGEQTHGVAIAPEEKLIIAKALLEKVKVDRIEIASALVSEGEKKAVKMITDWAKKDHFLSRIEVLGFVDGQRSADWLLDAGGRVMNLLTKGSYQHLTYQLKKTPEQHLSDIARTIEYCQSNKIECNCYPEAWSTGLMENNDYTEWFIRQLTQLPLKRIMLADTLGILIPEQVKKHISDYQEKFPETHFDFHGHNDYGLATANAFTAAAAGAKGIHVTVNGLGERTGNCALDEAVAVLHDHGPFQTNVDEKELVTISKMVEVFTGRRIAANKPVTGQAVFTQTAGIHADGDKKGNLYITKLSPERFNRTRTYALGKLSGKASLDINLEKLGIILSPEHKQLVLKRIIELGDKKQMITMEDLPFIINSVLQSPDNKIISISKTEIISKTDTLSTALVTIDYQGKSFENQAQGDGGFDAFIKAIKIVLEKLNIQIPQLLDYEVHIPPGGKTDALVETTILWEHNIKTRGVDTDQVKAAIQATENMLNIYLNKENKQQ